MVRKNLKLTIGFSILACTLAMPGSVKAAKTMTVDEATKQVTKQLIESDNLTMQGYLGSVSDDNLISTVAYGKNNSVVYRNINSTGESEMYFLGKNAYWLSSDGKWYHYSMNSDYRVSDYDKILPNDNGVILGTEKFLGKKCVVLKVSEKRIDRDVKYYIDASTKKLKGMVSGTKKTKVIIKVDTSKKVTIPAKVKKAKDKAYTRDERTLKGMNNVVCVKAENAVKAEKITSYTQLKKYISSLSSNDKMLINVLGSFDKNYFKKNVLLIKSKKMTTFGHGAFAVSRTDSSKNIGVTVAEYDMPYDITADTALDTVAVIVQAKKAQAKNVDITGLKIKEVKCDGSMPY